MNQHFVPVLDPEEKALVDRELRAGERLVWFGKPTRVGGQRVAAGCLFLFGIPFTGFALFWMGLAGFATGETGAPGLMKWFGLPFLLAGLSMLTWLPFWVLRQHRRLRYAITTQRAVLFQPGLFGRLTVRSYGPDRMASLTRNENADGSGDLVFESVTTSNGSSTSTTRYGFLGIEDVRGVEQLLLDTLLRDRARPLPGEMR
jgi:hypothetical protein